MKSERISGVTGQPVTDLLLVVKHHFLDHSSCFAIEIAEFAVLRLNLLRIDLGMVRKDVLPPLHFVHFLEVDLNRRLVLQCPGTVLDLDVLAEFPYQDGLFAFKPNAKFLLCDHDYKVTRTRSFRDGDHNVNILQGLLPGVREGLGVI